MILLGRALARLTGLLLLAILALAGLALAVFSVQVGTGILSAAKLSELLGLPGLRHTVGGFLQSLESHGSIAGIAALSGAGAVLLGMWLLAGALVPRSERLLVIESDPSGTLGARRRATAQAVRAVVEQSRDVERASVRVRPRRSGIGGRVRLTIDRVANAGQAATVTSARKALAPLSQSLSLRVRTRSRVSRRGRRVR